MSSETDDIVERLKAELAECRKENEIFRSEMGHLELVLQEKQTQISLLKKTLERRCSANNYLNLHPIAKIALCVGKGGNCSIKNSRATGMLLLTDSYLITFAAALKKLKEYEYLWIIFPCLKNIFNAMAEKISPEKLNELQNKVVLTKSIERLCPIDIRLVRVVKFEGSAIYFEGMDVPDLTPVFDIVPYVNGYHSPPVLSQFLANVEIKYTPVLKTDQISAGKKIGDPETKGTCAQDNEIPASKNSLDCSGQGIAKVSSEKPLKSCNFAEDICQQKGFFAKEQAETSTESNCLSQQSGKKQRDVQISENPHSSVPPTESQSSGTSIRNENNLHPADKIQDCPICRKTYFKKLDLIAHMKIHNLPHQCSICSYSFKTFTSLKKHLGGCRYNEKYVCCVCLKSSYANKSDLLQHVRLCLKTDEADSLHKCFVCSKICGTMRILRLHMSKHIKVKLYECEFCDKSFEKKLSLKNHLKNHYGTDALDSGSSTNKREESEDGALVIKKKKKKVTFGNYKFFYN